MTPTFVQIYNFINSLNDDEIIRATDQKLSTAELKKDKNLNFDNNKGATHLYVRSGFFSKLRQVLTSRTDDAMQKQNKAKDLIIKTLNDLPDNFKNDDSVKQSIKNITDTLKNNELKDFTAGMIRNDLDVINDAFKFQEGKVNPLYENNPQKQLNPLYKGNPTEPDASKSGANNTVAATTPTARKNIPPDGAEESFDSSLGSEAKNQEKIMARSEEKSESDIYFDADEELASEFESAVDDSAVSKISSDEVIPTYFDTAVLAEYAIESTPNATTSVSSSKTETKTNAKANPYLASLKSVWNPSSSGRHEITTLFSISGDVNSSNIIAQAYIHPSGKKLNFSGDAKKSVGTASSYITVEAEVPKSNFFIGAGPITNSRTENRLSQFRQALLKTYLESFNKINAEYKQLNSGKELETLVIVPISSTDGTLSDSHVTALVTAVRFIQNENVNLKIAISAEKDTHASRIRVAYEESVR